MASIADPVSVDPGALAGREWFRRFAWSALAWNILVVLWGAWVRASGSGAGCGSRWPLCNGEVVPRAPQTATIIEFVHRVTSGAAVLMLAALCVWALLRFPRRHPVRRLAALSVLFIVVEALLGAGLVLLRYVAHNESAGRAIYLSAHLLNTQLLLASIAMTAFFAAPVTPALKRPWSPVLVSTLPVALAVSVTGAVAALGDTLYPPASLLGAMQQDFSATAHLLLRLRLMHPAAAITGGSWIVLVAFLWMRDERARAAALASGALAILQLCAGALNVVLLAPVWMQILHLLLADLLWIALILLFLRSREARASMRVSVAE
jgi:heme A synthase